MDPDMEFNALAALSHSIISDMKQSFPAWEMVASRAIKLSQQLRNTVQCLSSFCDAVQSVSDCANNLKGATRDVGACVTRVCIRQRALETRFRTFADAFSEELSRGLTERTNYWKQRTSEMDKDCAKHIKKVRSRKRRPEFQELGEQRQICSQILTEQRKQFSFFINMLMPVLKTEMSLLDEGPHIRQAVETLEETIECVDSDKLVTTIVQDITQGADIAWKECLDHATLRHRQKSLGASEFDLTPTLMVRPQSLSLVDNGDKDYVPAKPPRGPKYSSGTQSVCVSPPLHHSPLSDSMFNMGQYNSGRLMRHYSMNGEPYASITPRQSAATSSCCSSEASAAMINETLQQIDQLGSDLENFCATSFDSHSVDPNQSATSSSFNNSIKMRGTSPKPPPPARRNSTIQAATPTAPSIVDARNSFMRGSRQSLNSSVISGSTTDLQHPNVNPYTKHSTFAPHYNL